MIITVFSNMANHCFNPFVSFKLQHQWFKRFIKSLKKLVPIWEQIYLLSVNSPMKQCFFVSCCKYWQWSALFIRSFLCLAYLLVCRILEKYFHFFLFSNLNFWAKFVLWGPPRVSWKQRRSLRPPNTPHRMTLNFILIRVGKLSDSGST